MHGTEIVDMRQDGSDPQRFGREPIEEQQRIQPDETPAGLVQAFHLDGPAGAALTAEAVGDKPPDGALGQHTAAPVASELVQAAPDPGCAGPEVNLATDPGQ